MNRQLKQKLIYWVHQQITVTGSNCEEALKLERLAGANAVSVVWVPLAAKTG